ncbi:discoidin domain-containing protein, partial [Bacteroidota bacterium]
KSDCAILDVCEVFNSTANTYYNLSPTVEMGSYSVTKDATKQATIVQGVFTSDVSATHFYVGHNGYPLPGGYDNITFTVPVTPTSNANEYSFYVEMPYSDIFNGYQAKDILQLSMVTLDENGNRNTPVTYDYTIDVLSPEPNDDILKEYTSFVLSDRSNWTITSSSTSGGNVAANAIDGDYATFWHSAWPYSIATSGSHEFTIDMGVSKQINGIYLFSERNPGNQFRPKTVRVEISNDGVNWALEKEETLSSIADAKEVFMNFTSSVVTKHIKLIISEVYSENTTDNLILVEIDVF